MSLPPLHIIKPTFAGGEYAPSMYSRVDVARYNQGLKTCRNFIIHVHGGASNRPGWHYAASAKYPTKFSRMVPFEFSSTQTYALEFGDQYIRFFTAQGQIAVSSATAWATTTAYVVGNYVSTGGVIYYCIVAHTSGTFATDLAAAKWVAQTIYEIPTPYLEADLPNLRFTQSADVLFIFHNSYQTKQLNRLGSTNWTLTNYAFTFGPFQLPNTDTTLTMTPSGTTGSITLTASAAYFASTMVGGLFQVNHPVAEQSVNSSLASVAAGTSILCGGTWRLITHGTWAGTIVVQKSTDGGSNWTNIRSFSGASDFNANTFGTEDMTNNAPAFLIRLNMTAYTSGTCSYTLTADAFRNIGCVQVTAYTSTTVITVTVTKRLGGTTATYDWAEGSWSDYRGWPAVGEFNQDRLVLGNTPREPQTIWQTRASNYYDFSRNVPLVDADGISTVIPARQQNGVNGFVPLSQLVALTSSSEWGIGAADSIMSPLTIQQKPFGFNGSNGLKPVIIKNRAIYVQYMGAVILDLGFELVSNSFTGADLSVLANHLFTGYTISDMCYQQYPDSIVWALRSDGVLLSMTYMREQEVIAWAHHDTDGLVKSLCSIPYNGYNQVWMTVRRGDYTFIEYMDHRMASVDPADQFFVDAGVTYNGSTPPSTNKLWLKFDGVNNSTTFTDSELTPKTVTVNGTGGCIISTDVSKVGTTSGKFIGGEGQDSYVKLLLHMDTDFTDKSSSPHTATLIGPPTLDSATKKFGAASGKFVGAQQVSFADSDDWYFGSGDFTIDAWISMHDGNFQYLCGQYADSTHYWSFGVATTAIQFIVINGTATYLFQATVVLSTDTFYHFALVRNGTNMLLFINGVAQTFTSFWDVLGTKDLGDVAAPLLIGKGQNVNTSNAWYDEVRISKGIARWTTAFTPGVASYANICYLSLADSGDWNFGTSDFTIEFYAYLTSLTACTIWSQGTDATHYAAIQFDGTNFKFVSPLGAAVTLTGTSTIAVSAWYHVAVVRYGNIWTLYVNGVAEATTTLSATYSNYTGVMTIGCLFAGSATQAFAGYLDEFKVTNGLARYISGFTPSVVSGFAINTVTGLTYLEGKTVSVLGDGLVQTQKQVVGGQITLDAYAVKIVVGLPYTSDLETLNIEAPLPDGTMQGRKVKVSRTTIRVLSSKSGSIGPDSSNLTPLTNVFASYRTTSALYTGDLKHTLTGGYSDGGRLFIRQTDPVPITVLGLMPLISVAGTTGEK